MLTTIHKLHFRNLEEIVQKDFFVELVKMKYTNTKKKHSI